MEIGKLHRLELSSIACTALALVLFGFIGFQQFKQADLEKVSEFQSAYSDFLKSLINSSCIERELVKKDANSKGWKLDENIHDWRLSVGQSKDTVASLGASPQRLRLFVEPPMPFTKEPGVVLFFGKDGCLQFD